MKPCRCERLRIFLQHQDPWPKSTSACSFSFESIYPARQLCKILRIVTQPTQISILIHQENQSRIVGAGAHISILRCGTFAQSANHFLAQANPLDRHDSSLARASNRPSATRKKRIPQTTFATHSSISYPQNTTHKHPFFPENSAIHHTKKSEHKTHQKNKKETRRSGGSPLLIPPTSKRSNSPESSRHSL